MADDKCPVCGANPCYRICPTQDPYQGDQAAENADYEFNARYDDVRERYASTAEDAEAFMDDDDIHDSFRPNDDGTVTYISPTGGEHTYDPDQAFPRERSDDDIPF
jgi:hypothetical protein